VDDQRFRAARRQRLRAFDSARRIAHAEPHLGGKRHAAPNGGLHRQRNRIKQLGFVEQHRAATVAIHRGRRTTEIEVNTRRFQGHQARGVIGEMKGIGTQKLNPHRRAGGRARGVLELRRHASETAIG
jgi:hypothetical protein